jgi:hypothetical protein
MKRIIGLIATCAVAMAFATAALAEVRTATLAVSGMT